MFGFFEDMYLTSKGFDPEKVREERALRTHKNHVPKIIAVFFGTLYIFLAYFGVKAALHSGYIFGAVKYIFLAGLIGTSAVSFCKNGRLLAFIGAVLFVVLNFIFHFCNL